jgi:hypothetical protein
MHVNVDAAAVLMSRQGDADVGPPTHLLEQLPGDTFST